MLYLGDLNSHRDSFSRESFQYSILDGARMMMVVIDGVERGRGGRDEAAGRVGERMSREACRVFSLVNS